MKLDLQLVLANATVFGAPLYKEEVVYGTVAPGEYEFNEEFGSLKIDIGDGKFISARIRQSVLDAGIDPTTQSFTIAKHVAVRSASGEIDGRAWSVEEGDAKDFAY